MRSSGFLSILLYSSAGFAQTLVTGGGTSETTAAAADANLFGPQIFVVDAGAVPSGSSVYPDIKHAYLGCLGQTNQPTCKIVDNNLLTAGTLPGNNEPWPGAPWNNDATEVPVDLELGCGALLLFGPLVVPRNSRVHGCATTAGGTCSRPTERRWSHSLTSGGFCRLRSRRFTLKRRLR